MANESPIGLTALVAAGHTLTSATFREQGICVADWAREQGFSPRLVYQVLAGRRKSLRGQSFLVAKALGMK